MDIKEPSQSGENKKGVDPEEQPVIRTMAKDLAALQKKGLPSAVKKPVAFAPAPPKKPVMPGKKEIPLPGRPPAGLPVIESARRPIPPRPPKPGIPSKPVIPAKPAVPLKKKPSFISRILRFFGLKRKPKPAKPKKEEMIKKPVVAVRPPRPERPIMPPRPTIPPRPVMPPRPAAPPRPVEPLVIPPRPGPIPPRPMAPPVPGPAERIRLEEQRRKARLAEQEAARKRLEKKKIEKAKEIKPLKPKESQFKFVVITLAVILIVGGLGGFFYWWNYLRPIPPVTHYQCQDSQCVSVEGAGLDECQTDEDCRPLEPVEPVIPDSLIPIERTNTIEVPVGQEALLIDGFKAMAKQEQTQGTLRRILVKLIDEQEKSYMDLGSLISALDISIPTSILQAVASSEIEADNYTIFLYKQAEGSRLGIVIDMRESPTLVQDLKSWETGIVNDLKPLLLQNGIPPAFTEEFQDNLYQDIALRYLNFPYPDLSIDYGLVTGKLLITTSRESTFAAVDALLAGQASE